MSERRQVTRREPITVVTSQGDLEAQPLPWRIRNDLGDLIIQTFVASVSAMQGALSLDDEGKPIGGIFDDKAIDWDGLIKISYPSVDKEFIEKLDIYELRAALTAALDVNDMKHLGYMVDPNSVSPKTEETALSEVSDGKKIMSIPDSGSPGTTE